MWRPSTTDDHPAIIDCYLALDAEDPGVCPADAARMQRTLGLFEHEPGRGRCVVLDEGGSLQGYALLVPYWSNELGGLVCCIDEMYVGPLARGRGRGSDLLTQLSTGTIGFGDSTVALQLEVSPSNSRAQVLYERLGFRQARNATLVRPLKLPR